MCVLSDAQCFAGLNVPGCSAVRELVVAVTLSVYYDYYFVLRTAAAVTGDGSAVRSRPAPVFPLFFTSWLTPSPPVVFSPSFQLLFLLRPPLLWRLGNPLPSLSALPPLTGKPRISLLHSTAARPLFLPSASSSIAFLSFLEQQQQQQTASVKQNQRQQQEDLDSRLVFCFLLLVAR